MPANTTLGLLLEAKTTGQQDIDRLTDALNKFTSAAENSAKRTEEANRRSAESTKQFAETIKGAISEPLKFAGEQAEKFILSIGKTGAIALGAAGGLALIGKEAFELTERYAEAAKQTVNFAQRLGISIGEAQKLGAQAKLAGVDIGVLESSTRVLANALEDSTGSGQKAYKALLQLGIATRQSNGEQRELGQVMTEVIQKLASVEDVTKRTALASQILGRSSKEIQPLIQQYEETRKAVDELGIGLNEAGTRKLVEFHEAVTKSGLAFDQFKKQLAVKIAPLLIPIVAVVTDIIRGGPGGSVGTAGKPLPTGDPKTAAAIASRTHFGSLNPNTINPFLIGQFFEDRANADQAAAAEKALLGGSPEFISSQIEENKRKIKEAQGAIIDKNVDADARAEKQRQVSQLDAENSKLELRLKLIQNAKRAEEELLHIRESVAAKTGQNDVLSRFLGIDPRLFQSGALSPSNLSPARQQFLQFATQPGVSDSQRSAAAKALQPLISQEDVLALERFRAVGKKAQEDELKNLPEFYKDLFGIRDEKNINTILAERQKVTEAAFRQDISDTNPLNRVRSESQPVLEQQLSTDAAIRKTRTLSSLRLAGTLAGPEAQLAVILATAAAQKQAADEENLHELALITAKYAYDGSLQDRLYAQKLKSVQEIQDIELQAAEKLAELQKQRLEENKQFAGNLYDAITSGTTRQFFSGILHNTGKTVFENVFSSTLNGGRFQIPGQTDANGQPNILGKLLQGTIFGIDPLKGQNLALTANTDATTVLTNAIDALITTLGGSVPAGAIPTGGGGGGSIPLNFGGFNLPGLTTSGGAFENNPILRALGGSSGGAASLPNLIRSIGSVFGGGTGSGEAPQSTGTPGGLPGDFGGETSGTSGQAAVRSRIGSGSIAAPLFDPNASTSQRFGAGIASAGAVYAGVQNTIHDFRQGGAQGIIGGIGSIAGTAALFDPEPISKSILAGVALASQVVTSIFGDPKQNRQNQINKRLFTDQFYAPTPINVTESTTGGYVTNDRFGNIQSTDLSPYTSVQEPYSDITHRVQVPGRVLLPYGGPGPTPSAAPPVVFNYSPQVSAIDGPSVQRVFDQHASTILDSLSKGVSRGHGQGFLNTLAQFQ